MTLEEIEKAYAQRSHLVLSTHEIDWLISRVKELEEGIRNLKAERNAEGIAMEELYKLL